MKTKEQVERTLAEALTQFVLHFIKRDREKQEKRMQESLYDAALKGLIPSFDREPKQ